MPNRERPVRSISVLVKSLSAEPFKMTGFKLSDSIGYIRNQFCRRVREDGLKILKPEQKVLRLPGRSFNLQDDWTLRNLFDRIHHQGSTITIIFFPAVMGEKAWKPPPKTAVYESEEEDLCEDIFLGARRPKRNMLPWSCASVQDLRVDGPIVLKHNDKPITVHEVRSCTFLRTTASVVLLALNERIWKTLCSFNAQHNCQYLVVRVSWDSLSYIFLRILRAVYLHLPIVAVTDLNPYHLDLLAFLDTIPDHVQPLYGWDLYQECEDAAVTDIEYVEIKWLGLRPSDCVSYDLDSQALPSPGDINKVIDKIMLNGHFIRKKEWVKELNGLRDYRKCVVFEPRGPLKDLIADRVFNKEWI